MCSAGATGGSRRAASFGAVLVLVPVPPASVNTPARLAGEQIRFLRRHWRLAL
ncbi:MAG: hypothetical protein HYU42_06540 [Candidatus Rokubacteria bacterium]|nr:hypothetical protein [Candidatus Rokubacteria bacterium]